MAIAEAPLFEKELKMYFAERKRPAVEPAEGGTSAPEQPAWLLQKDYQSKNDGKREIGVEIKYWIQKANFDDKDTKDFHPINVADVYDPEPAVRDAFLGRVREVLNKYKDALVFAKNDAPAGAKAKDSTLLRWAANAYRGKTSGFKGNLAQGFNPVLLNKLSSGQRTFMEHFERLVTSCIDKTSGARYINEANVKAWNKIMKLSPACMPMPVRLFDGADVPQKKLYTLFWHKMHSYQMRVMLQLAFAKLKDPETRSDRAKFVFDDAKNPTNLYLGPLGKESKSSKFAEFFEQAAAAPEVASPEVDALEAEAARLFALAAAIPEETADRKERKSKHIASASSKSKALSKKSAPKKSVADETPKPKKTKRGDKEENSEEDVEDDPVAVVESPRRKKQKKAATKRRNRKA